MQQQQRLIAPLLSPSMCLLLHSAATSAVCLRCCVWVCVQLLLLLLRCGGEYDKAAAGAGWVALLEGWRRRKDEQKMIKLLHKATSRPQLRAMIQTVSFSLPCYPGEAGGFKD